jgi:hypothetical protein
MLAAQSAPERELGKAWERLCNEGKTKVIPQFIASLEMGFLYCGLRKWPCPRFPSNYTEADDVHAETGSYAGLGLAWILTQHQGRLAAARRQSLGAIHRFARLLDDAMLRESTPPTYSPRFHPAFSGLRPITGVMGWGGVLCYAHNGLHLCSLSRSRDGEKAWWHHEYLRSDVDPASLDTASARDAVRWFRYSKEFTAGQHLAVEEWIDHSSREDHRSRIAVFDITDGREMTGPLIDGMEKVSDLGEILPDIIRGEPPRG